MADEDFGGDNDIKPPDGARGRAEFGHVPVLLQEATDFLAIRRGGTYIDATVGLGGHSFEIAKRLGPQGHLIGFDKDSHALDLARKHMAAIPDEKPGVTLLHSSYAEISQRTPPLSVDGILADLGMSSLQLSDPARGFSFQADGPLDMRMNPQSERTADQVVNQMREEEIANLIYEFGEERRSRRIARAIVRARPITGTAHLAEVIAAALRSMKDPQGRFRPRIHPATRTFQAIRIHVNRELDDLKAMLQAAPQILKPGGRLVVISFHSLEDRIVKDALRAGAHEGIYRLLTKKPVEAREEEMRGNPRSRSAKLRAAEKLPAA